LIGENHENTEGPLKNRTPGTSSDAVEADIQSKDREKFNKGGGGGVPADRKLVCYRLSIIPSDGKGDPLRTGCSHTMQQGRGQNPDANGGIKTNFWGGEASSGFLMRGFSENQ